MRSEKRPLRPASSPLPEPGTTVIDKDWAPRSIVPLCWNTKLPRLPKRQAPLVATMVVEVFSAMLVIAARRPDERKRMLDETKVMLRRYLEPFEDKVRSKR